MFWKGDPKPTGLEIGKPRIRDLRPGDTVVFNGWRRKAVQATKAQGNDIRDEVN